MHQVELLNEEGHYLGSVWMKMEEITALVQRGVIRHEESGRFILTVVPEK